MEGEDRLKAMIQEKGFRVLVHTPYCDNYQKGHSNCLGCESEKGCKKRFQIMSLMAMCDRAKNDTPAQVKANMEWFGLEVDKVMKEA